MGDSDSVNAISLSLPPAWLSNLSAWFRSVEAQFRSRKQCSGTLSQRFQKVGLPNLFLTTTKTSTLNRATTIGNRRCWKARKFHKKNSFQCLWVITAAYGVNLNSISDTCPTSHVYFRFWAFQEIKEKGPYLNVIVITLL